jgi:flagellar motor component MotA
MMTFEYDQLWEFTASMGEIASRILDFSEKARREGLLALEEEIDANNSDMRNGSLFWRGLRLVVDGTDSDYIRDIMHNYMVDIVKTLEVSHTYDASNILARCMMITRGVLGIQNGDNPRIIALTMDSLIPSACKGPDYELSEMLESALI